MMEVDDIIQAIAAATFTAGVIEILSVARKLGARLGMELTGSRRHRRSSGKGSGERVG
jgi:hypothetical protein